mgnify:CR=1 FL=1
MCVCVEYGVISDGSYQIDPHQFRPQQNDLTSIGYLFWAIILVP